MTILIRVFAVHSCVGFRTVRLIYIVFLFRATVMVCSILPRDQNLHPRESLPRTFLHKFNNTASAVNQSLGRMEMRVPWMKYMEIPGFQSSYGELYIIIKSVSRLT